MSKLEIGEVIRRMRREKDMTQEQLAQIIGVSIPAVSKWESGISYPDITILPNLARLFDISIDRLMNFNTDLSEEELLKLISKLQLLINKGHIEEYINLSKEYTTKYSNNYKLKSNVAALNTLAFIQINDNEIKSVLIESSIENLNKVVDNTNDIELKESALVQLSSQYTMKEESDKAEETIKKIYKPSCNPDIMLPIIYMQQGKLKEARQLMQKNLYISLMEAINSANSLGMIYYNYNDKKEEDYIDFDKAQKYYELSLNIKKTIEDDKTMYANYLNLAHIELIKGDVDACIKYLNTMLEYVRKTNLNEYVQMNTKWCFNEIEEENLSMKMDIYMQLIKSIEEAFSSLNENEEYKYIVKQLNYLSEENKLK